MSTILITARTTFEDIPGCRYDRLGYPHSGTECVGPECNFEATQRRTVRYSDGVTIVHDLCGICCTSGCDDVACVH